MGSRHVARAILTIGFAFVVTYAPSAHADSILTVDGVEIWRVTGPLAVGATRLLAPTDVIVSDLAVIRGLSVAVTNDGTSGAIEIELDSFEWGVAQPPTIPPREPDPTSLVFVQDFAVTKHANPTKVNLFSHCCLGHLSGDPLQSLRIANDVDVELLALHLSDVAVGGASLSGATAGGTLDLPAEAVSLNYMKLEITYSAETKGGPLVMKGFSSSHGWDFVPEPSTIGMLGVAALGLIGYACRRRR